MAALVMAIGVLAFLLPVVTFRLLHDEGAAFRWREWRALGRHLFARGGLWSGRGRAILAFLNPRFHPWTYRDDSRYLTLRSDLVRPD